MSSYSFRHDLLRGVFGVNLFRCTNQNLFNLPIVTGWNQKKTIFLKSSCEHTLAVTLPSAKVAKNEPDHQPLTSPLWMGIFREVVLWKTFLTFAMLLRGEVQRRSLVIPHVGTTER